MCRCIEREGTTTSTATKPRQIQTPSKVNNSGHDVGRTEVNLPEGSAPDLPAQLVLAADDPVHPLLLHHLFLRLSALALSRRDGGWKGSEGGTRVSTVATKWVPEKGNSGRSGGLKASGRSETD